jgi:UDP-glucose 4-epimerase
MSERNVHSGWLVCVWALQTAHRPALLEDESAHGDVFNLGGVEQLSIGHLAERVIAATGSTSDIVHLSYKEAYGDGFEDIRRRVPDSTQALEQVGFRPRRSLEDVIADVAAHRRVQEEADHAQR